MVEGNTDVIALRQAGFEPVVAAMGTALTEGTCASSTASAAGCSCASTPTPQVRTRRSAAWSSRWEGVRRTGRDAAAGPGPGRRAAGLRGAAGRRRELPPLPRADRDRASRGPPGGFCPGAGDPRAGRGLAASGRRRCACSRTDSTCRRRRSRAWHPREVGGLAPPSRRRGCSPRATASSATRSRRASYTLRSAASSRRSAQTTSTPSCTGSSAPCSSRTPPRTPSSWRSGRSSTHGPIARRSTSAPGRSCFCACGSAG